MTPDELLAVQPANRARIVVLRSGLPTQILPITDGRITIEAERTPRRTLDATVFGDLAMVPKRWYDVLDSRAEIELRADIGVADPATGEEFWWPQGVYLVRNSSIRSDTSQVSIDFTATDKSTARQWPMEGGVAIPTATSVERAVEMVLASTKTPVVGPNTPPTGYHPVGTWTPSVTGFFLPSAILGKLGDSAWQISTDLLKSIGWDLAYDVTGVGRMTKIVDPTTVTPTVTYVSAEEFGPAGPHARLDVGEQDWPQITRSITSPLTAVNRQLSGDQMVDGIILEWAGGLVYHPNDYLPRFPGVWDGDESLILNADMAKEAAKADYLKRVGQVEEISFTTIADPRREVNEIVRVIDHHSGTDLTGRIVGLGYILGSPTMEVRLAARNFDKGA